MRNNNYQTIKEVDKFDNKTTMKLDKRYRLSRDLGILSAGAELSVRYLSMPDADSFFIDFYYSASEGVHDFLYLDGGNMIIRINDCENITLPFIATDERSASSFKDFQRREHICRNEYNFVEIDKAILEKLCNATIVEIKMGGRNPKIFDASKCQGFIGYCKSFYNGLYNETENTVGDISVNTVGDISVERRFPTKIDPALLIIITIALVLLVLLIILCLYFE